MSENKNQKSCRYCHDPFLDLSGRTDYEIDLEDDVYDRDINAAKNILSA